MARLPAIALLLFCALSVRADDPTPDQLQFFEKRIRPVLVEHCFECHSASGEKIKGNLLLDSRDSLRKGGDSGPAITPGDPDKSLLIQAIRHTHEDLQMPPKKKLGDATIADFETWVKMGAPDPRITHRGPTGNDDSAAIAFTAAERAHWSLQPVKPPAIPAVHTSAWPITDIDRFILATLESHQLQPAPPADKATLIRRAALDLHGLPPTPEEVSAFLNDTASNAWEKVIDRLLASPRYGERWARHWLDLARYAESDGFKEDEARPFIWRYRDYVIDAFNSDKPYDRFVMEQIAGDELWPDDLQAKIATAFNRHYPDEWNARNLFERRQQILDDMTDTVGSVFLGLTVGCARCHNHKYDPIRQIDYYRLQAFFANTAAADQIPLVSEAEMTAYREKLAVWEEAAKEIRAEIAKLEAPAKAALVKEYFTKYPPEIQAILNKPADQCTPYERQMAHKANQYLSPDSMEFVGRTSKMMPKLKAEQKKRWQELQEQLKPFAHLHPGQAPMAQGVTDISAQAPPTHLLQRGMYHAPKQQVEPGFLSILDPSPARIQPLPNSTGRRSALAKMLADPDNPLTARVMVNRIWHYHFGRGIVATPSDFGAKADGPSHPQLLDHLAHDFVQGGWRIKRLHRLIMTSAVYRQSSSSVGSASADRLFSSFPRQRLEAESIRDAMLAVSGLLNLKAGGASVFPELPPGAPNRGNLWKPSPDPAERNRRSIYIFVRRNNRYPLLEPFDMPDSLETCARRNCTTTPLQALTLLNNTLTLQWAQSFASRILKEAPATQDDRITHAFTLAFSRAPSPEELSTVRTWFEQHLPLLESRHASGEKLALPTTLPNDLPAPHAAAWVDLCHMLMNANEFVYRP